MSGKILQLFLVLGGLGTLAFSTVSLARRRMNGTLSLVWGLFSLLMILAGCLIHPVNLHLYLSGRGLALALLGSLCLLAAAYFISVELTELMRRTRETTIQASLPRPEGRPREKELLVVIPAYNEEGNIGKLIRGLREADVESYADILVVDDGSEDGTRREAEALGCLCVRGIYNQGYGTALQMGYRYALGEGYSYVVQMDADGQHDVGAVAELYRALREPGFPLFAGGRDLPAALGAYAGHPAVPEAHPVGHGAADHGSHHGASGPEPAGRPGLRPV